MRLNQFLARSGVAARRKGDLLIASGRIRVNGEPAAPGMQVDPARDRVTLDARVVRLPNRKVYLMVNKPSGVLTTTHDQRGRPTVLDLAPAARRVFPVGRLDLASRGLVLLTDDGELTVRLLHPRYHVEKEYRVRLGGRPSPDALDRIREGLMVGKERFAPATARVLRAGRTGTVLSMVLREGRKREIRRMWLALGETVADLERVRIGTLRLGGLRRGAARPLTAAEIGALRRSVGLL